MFYDLINLIKHEKFQNRLIINIYAFLIEQIYAIKHKIFNKF